MISTASPPPTVPSNRSPARTSPMMRSVPGTSRACTAYPSRTERASAGMSRSARISSASTRPAAHSSATYSGSAKMRPAITCSITHARASSKLRVGTKLFYRRFAPPAVGGVRRCRLQPAVSFLLGLCRQTQVRRCTLLKRAPRSAKYYQRTAGGDWPEPLTCLPPPPHNKRRGGSCYARPPVP